VGTEVEIAEIDLRYERCRLRHGPSERALLRSVAEEGVREPLLGITRNGRQILLDGFKRLRCAKKLGIEMLPFRSLADDEPQAIVALMRRSNAAQLSMIEQACLIDELCKAHGLSVREIAQRLERSSAWVSVRRGVLDEMPAASREKVMRGDFPLYAYMYHVRQFMRINKAPPAEVDAFVVATSGKGLSVRDIELLAGAYFRGGDATRGEITGGNISWCLETLRRTEERAAGCTEKEKGTLVDLEIAGRKMKRLVQSAANPQLKTPAFFAQAQILCDGILRVVERFTTEIRGLYDRSRPSSSHCSPSRQGHGSAPDRAAPGDQPQHGEEHHRAPG
jgi:hypothetical protein